MHEWFRLCWFEWNYGRRYTPEEFAETVAAGLAPLVSVFHPSGELVHPPKREEGESSGEKRKAEAEGEKKEEEEEEAEGEESMAGGESPKKKKKKKKSKKKKKK